MSDTYQPLCGYNPPPEPRFGNVPQWDERNPVLPESQWREHDDYAALWPRIEAQVNNNCTNSALANAAHAAFRIAGIDAPRFSWASNYARHNGGRDQGAFCRQLAWDFKDGPGLLPASMWPDNRIYGQWTEEHRRAASEWMALEIYQCMSFADVMSALSLGFTLYHGFVLGQGGVSNPRDGRVPEYDGQFANGHAMASRGITRRFGDWRTITVNSWGTQWGDKGVGYWPASYWWVQRGQFVNMEAFAIRAVVHNKPLPVAA